MRLIVAFIVAILFGQGLAETLVIYPFASQDALAGIAVAERIASNFDDGIEVLGPAVTPGIVPPVVVAAGFINPVVFLGETGFGDPTGAALLRDGSGADLAVTGVLLFEDSDAVLLLYLSGATSDSVTVRAPIDQLGRLADRASIAVSLHLGGPRPTLGGPVDLSGPYGDHARAVGLVGAGLVDEARAQLEDLVQQGADLLPETEALLADLRAVADDRSAADPALGAVVAINDAAFDETRAIRYQQAFGEASALPVADLWIGALAASINDRSLAEAAFGRAAAAYPYGAVARAGYREANGIEGVEQDIAAVDAAFSQGRAGPATLLGLSILADGRGDADLAKLALQRLGRVAPFFAYPFERLSFIAFDEDDGLAAAEAMAVAVELVPDSDLYWTNYGWALYLVGLLDQSEAASIRAVELDPAQFIAHYNLGLARVVTGRLELAMDDYSEALRFDAGVDDEAIHDLENALLLYPDEPAIHFALANLYQAEGRRAEAADQYELYLMRSDEERPAFAGVAERRIEALRAPPPPIEIAGAVELTLGRRGIAAEPFHPGEDIYLRFEIFTPGESLPESVEVTVALYDQAGVELDGGGATVDVPPGAIGYVIDNIALPLPATLAAGSYHVEVVVRADETRETSTETVIAVEGAPELLRQLLGRNIVMQALETGLPLFDERDLARPELLAQLLIDELQATADAADQALPVVESGRFEGMGGGEMFRSSTDRDVEDFVSYLLAQGTGDSDFTFVDAYAQWALDGAPPE